MKLMKLKADKKEMFEKRINKFLGIAGEKQVHIHDSGRLERLLYKGNEVLLKRAYGKRKTKWDLLAAMYENKWVLTNSFFHSRIAEKLIEAGIPFKASKIDKEIKYGESRIDFLLDKKILMEVKGCTFEENGEAMFPDAPTARGRRHLMELMNALQNGYEAIILFLIFVPSHCFKPNEIIDKKFAEIFYRGLSEGMKVYSALIEYDGEWIYHKKMIPLCL